MTRVASSYPYIQEPAYCRDILTKLFAVYLFSCLLCFGSSFWCVQLSRWVAQHLLYPCFTISKLIPASRATESGTLLYCGLLEDFVIRVITLIGVYIIQAYPTNPATNAWTPQANGARFSCFVSFRCIVSFPDPFSLYFSSGVNCDLPAIRSLEGRRRTGLFLGGPFQPWLIARSAI